jgi:hypothetical protein
MIVHTGRAVVVVITQFVGYDPGLHPDAFFLSRGDYFHGFFLLRFHHRLILLMINIMSFALLDKAIAVPYGVLS